MRCASKEGLAIRLRQDDRRCWRRDRRLVPLLAHVGRADVLLDADLRRLKAVAFADLLADAGERMRHCAFRAHLLFGRQVVLDLNAREVIRDRLAATVGGTLALVRFDLRGALAVRLISRLNGAEHLRLVEQHLLVGILFGRIGALRGTPVVPAPSAPYFFSSSTLRSNGLLMFALELLVGVFDLLESLVLRAQQPYLLFGDFQTDGKLSVFIHQCDGFLFGASTHKLYCAEQITQYKTVNSHE